MEPKIISNGSKWGGQSTDPLENLEEMLKTYELDDFARTKTNKDGSVTFFGNFKHFSHVFHVILYDDKQIRKFRRLFYKNKSAK